MIFVSMFPRTETLLRGFRRELALTAFQVAFNFLFHHLPSIRVWYTHVTCMSSLFFIKITHGALFSSDVSDGYSLDATPGRTGGGIAGTWLSSSHRGNPFRRGSSARPSIQSPHLPTSPSVRSAPRNADRDATHTRRDIHSVHYYVREYAARSFSNPSDISICQMAYPPPRARRGYARSFSSFILYAVWNAQVSVPSTTSVGQAGDILKLHTTAGPCTQSRQ